MEYQLLLQNAIGTGNTLYLISRVKKEQYEDSHYTVNYFVWADNDNEAKQALMTAKNLDQWDLFGADVIAILKKS